MAIEWEASTPKLVPLVSDDGSLGERVDDPSKIPNNPSNSLSAAWGDCGKMAEVTPAPNHARPLLIGSATEVGVQSNRRACAEDAFLYRKPWDAPHGYSPSFHIINTFPPH